jgi:hypothetical protein
MEGFVELRFWIQVLWVQGSFPDSCLLVPDSCVSILNTNFSNLKSHISYLI